MKKKGNFWKINQCITDVFLDSLNFNEVYKNRFNPEYFKEFDFKNNIVNVNETLCKNQFYNSKYYIHHNFGNYVHYEFSGYRNKKEAKKYRRKAKKNEKTFLKGKKISLEGKNYYCEYSFAIYPYQKIHEILTNGKDSIPGKRILKINLYENEFSIFPFFTGSYRFNAYIN
jgi:DNA mismatch repair ATPase MutS